MGYMPEGADVLTPYLILDDAAAAIEFYRKAFGAEEVMRLNAPDSDAVMHAELKIGGAMIMLSQENPDCGMVSAKSLGNSPISLYIYVPDVDAACAKAVEAGATADMPVADMFWGDRVGSVKCPHGFTWTFATHIRTPTREEIEAGARAMYEQMAAGNG